MVKHEHPKYKHRTKYISSNLRKAQMISPEAGHNKTKTQTESKGN